MADPWIGPAIVAAIVSGIISIVGWFATFYIGLRRDRMMRDEKVHDVQVALRAEVLSDLIGLSLSDRRRYLADATRRYGSEADYSVVVPRLARNPIYESLLGDIQILPAEVIEPLVHYERLRETVEQFISDLRDPSFRALLPQRQLLMYSDYLEMLGRLEILAREVEAVLAASLNIQDADRRTPQSASAMGGASASQQEQP